MKRLLFAKLFLILLVLMLVFLSLSLLDRCVLLSFREEDSKEALWVGEWIGFPESAFLNLLVVNYKFSGCYF